jgi:VWFA-related protein
MRAAVTMVYLLALGQAAQVPPIKSGVALVTVDVTVVDADGRPVPDLTAADFEIRLNNRVQPIRGFGYLQVADTSMAGAVGPSFDAAPAAPAAAKTGAGTVPRVFVVLVDDLSFPPLEGKDLLSAAQRFITSLPATDVVGLATSSGTVVVNPTLDRAPVLAGLPKITGAFQDPRVGGSGPDQGKLSGPDEHVGIAQALSIDRGDSGALRQAVLTECLSGDNSRIGNQTIEELLSNNSCARTVQLDASRTAAYMKALVQRQAQAYVTVIRAMHEASGIRHLLLLTDGVTLAQDLSAMQPVARAAAEAGVQLSVMMSTPDISLEGGRRPLPALAPTSSANDNRQNNGGTPQKRREDNALLLNGARTTADITGAAFYQVTGEPDRFFERVTRAASGIYRIAVDAPSDTAPGKDFALAVRVPKRSGMTVRANRHAVAVSPTATSAPAPPPPSAPAAARALVPPDAQMRRAIASGRALTGLDVTLDSVVRRADDPAQVAIDVVVTIAAAAKPPLSTMFGLVDGSGAIRTSDKTLTEATDRGYRLEFSVSVAPGAYKLRFAAADASGAVGAIELPVDAALRTLGPLQASGIVLQPLPGPQRGILAAIDLYPPAGGAPPDLVVKLALLSPSGDVVLERVIVPDEVDAALHAEAEFALDHLPPGAYTVRATVLSGGTALGVLTRQIR